MSHPPRARPLLLLLLPLLVAAACAGGGGGRRRPGIEPDASGWSSPLLRDHPLIGRIWDVRRGAWVEEEALLAELAAARYVLLGEKHDNPDHHRLQAHVLRSLLSRGGRPALVMEMVDVEQQPALDAALAAAPRDPDAVQRAAEWGKSGWPDWDYYRPIVAAALEAGVGVTGGNVSRRQARALVMQTPGALEPAVRTRLGLDVPLAPAVAEEMREEMRESHCGALPEVHLEPMVGVQRARDAMMADRMLAADRGEGAVLIAGAGHVRNDRGVPAYLAQRAPDRPALSLSFAQVRPAQFEPAAYASDHRAGALPFDYVWFTPAVEEGDPCAPLRARKRGAS